MKKYNLKLRGKLIENLMEVYRNVIYKDDIYDSIGSGIELKFESEKEIKLPENVDIGLGGVEAIEHDDYIELRAIVKDNGDTFGIVDGKSIFIGNIIIKEKDKYMSFYNPIKSICELKLSTTYIAKAEEVELKLC